MFDPLFGDEACAGGPAGLLLQPQADLLVAVVIRPVRKVLGASRALEGPLPRVDPLVSLDI